MPVESDAAKPDHALMPKQRPVRERTVRTVLIWLVLSCLLPGILGATAFFVFEYRQNSLQLERDTLQTSRALAQAVDNYILRVQALAQGLATSDSLAEGDLARFHRQARAALEASQLGSAVVLADRDGRQVLNTAMDFGLPLPMHGNQEVVRQVFQNAQPVISDIFFGPVLGRPLMAVAVPVLRDGKPVFLLNINVILERFNEILTVQGLPPEWIVTIFDSHGTIAARSQDAERFSGLKPAEGYFNKLMAAREGSFNAVMRDGIEVRAAYTSAPVTQWRVALSIPKQALVSQFSQRVSVLAIGIAGMFAIGLWLARLIAGRINRSFHVLIDPAMSLGAGGPVFLPEPEIAEAAAVAAAIGDASVLLEERNAALTSALRTLRESESRLALALKAGGTAVWELDLATETLLPADDLLFTMVGYAPGEIRTAAEWTALVHEDDRTGIPEMISDVIEGRKDSYWHELRLRTKDGSWRWILSHGIVGERDAQGKATRLIGTHTDITERKLAQDRARQAALHDPLTGLPNRALVFEYGNHLIAGARRLHGRGALLFIDLDRFKPINDLYGHETGDRVLQEVARRLRAGTREEDLVGRIGGDEFVVILPHLEAGRHRAATVAQHLVDNISRPYCIDTLEVSLSPSIGISFYPEHASDISALIHAADLAMYLAKQTGRANYKFYTPELERQADEALTLETQVKAALSSGGLTLHYQPVIDIGSGRITGAEALVRLSDVNGDTIGPDRFIPVAESAGLIGELGEWVVTEACRQHEAWRRDGMELSIAINVSPLQFRQRDFAEKLNGIISDTGVDPSCLQVEVTETAIMDNLDEAVRILNRIKSLGVKVSLDDFGTGYSSLSRLTTLPLDKLKVDQSFVRGIGNDQASRAVTGAIIALGRSLNLDVIGEGIETEDALSYLREHGCNQAQGFWFSKPLPAAEFAAWYRQYGDATRFTSGNARESTAARPIQARRGM